MKQIFGKFLVLGLYVFPLSLTALSQETSSPQHRLWLNTKSQPNQRLAQAQPNNLIVEAERLLNLCRQHLSQNNATEAIKSCQQAVTASQKIGDRSREAKSTVNLGLAYLRRNEINPSIPNLEIRANQLNQAISNLEKGLIIAQDIKERKVEGIALYNLGLSYQSLGQNEKAINFFKESIKIARELGNRQQEAWALGDLGIVYKSLNQSQKAIELFQQALTILRDIGDQQGELIALEKLGNTYTLLEQHEKAIEFHQQALTILRDIGNRQGEMIALAQIGHAYTYLKKYPKANQFYQQGLKIARDLGGRGAEASSLGDLGVFHESIGEYQKASKFYAQALEIFKKIGDLQGEANALTSLGNIYIALEEIEKAIEFYKQALIKNKNIGNRTEQAHNLGNIGIAFQTLGKHEQAIKFQEEALNIFQDIGDLQGKTKALRHLSLAYFSIKEYQKFIKIQQETLEIFRDYNDRPGETDALITIGNAYGLLEEYQKAIKFSKQALAISEDIGYHQGEVQASNTLANVYHYLGQYQEAIKFSKQALAISEDLGDHQGKVQALQHLGNAYTSSAEYEKAITVYRQALTISKNNNNDQGETDSLGNLGVVYEYLGQYKKAINFHEQSLERSKKIGDRDGEGASLNHLGNVYTSIGQYEKSIEFHQQSLEIAKEIGNRPGEESSLGNLGNAYKRLEKYEKSIEFFQQALEIAKEIGNREGEANGLGNIGLAYYFLGDYKRAIKFQQEALAINQEIADPISQANTLSNIGSALRKSGRLKEAEMILRDSMKVSESVRKNLNDSNKVSFFERQTYPYHELQKVLIAQNRPQEALEIAERGRTRALVELLAQQLSTTNKPPSIAEIKEIAQEHKATVVEYSIIADDYKPSELYIWVIQPTGEIRFRQVDLKPLEQQQQQKSNNIFASFPNIFLNLGDIYLFSWHYPLMGVLSLVAIGSLGALAVHWKRRNPTRRSLISWILALVAFSSTSSVIFLIINKPETVATRSSSPSFVSPPQTPLAKLVHSTNKSLGVKGRGTDNNVTKGDSDTLLKELHELLIDPIADLLPDDPNAHVIFVPQGSLFFVPFPALKNASGKYLIENHTILTAPSIQVLGLTRQHQQRIDNLMSPTLTNTKAVDKEEETLEKPSVLVVGNPKMPPIPLKLGEEPTDNVLSPLPAAEKEAKTIAKLLNTQPLIGSQATETTVRQQLPNSTIIHLATHGLLDNFYLGNIPGAIALTPSPPNDGLLTADEIFQLQLNAELVVLSACETGLGLLTSDGVVGLSRALINAGVPTLVLSLWSVPDAPTGDLMIKFYQNLDKTSDKAQALRQAMLETMREHPEPNSWAGFTLIGEAK